MLKNKGGKSLVEFLPSRSFPLFQQSFSPYKYFLYFSPLFTSLVLPLYSFLFPQSIESKRKGKIQKTFVGSLSELFLTFLPGHGFHGTIIE